MAFNRSSPHTSVDDPQSPFYLPTVKRLIENFFSRPAANVNQEVIQGLTLLHLAAGAGQEDLVNRLLQAGANKDIVTPAHCKEGPGLKAKDFAEREYEKAAALIDNVVGEELITFYIDRGNDYFYIMETLRYWPLPNPCPRLPPELVSKPPSRRHRQTPALPTQRMRWVPKQPSSSASVGAQRPPSPPPPLLLQRGVHSGPPGRTLSPFEEHFLKATPLATFSSLAPSVFIYSCSMYGCSGKVERQAALGEFLFCKNCESSHGALE